MTTLTSWEQMMEDARNPPSLPRSKIVIFLDTIQEWDHDGVCELFCQLFTTHPELIELFHIDEEGELKVK